MSVACGHGGRLAQQQGCTTKRSGRKGESEAGWRAWGSEQGREGEGEAARDGGRERGTKCQREGARERERYGSSGSARAGQMSEPAREKGGKAVTV